MSLETISPLWAEKLKRGNLNPTKKMNLSDPETCLVSEAWGFGSDYLHKCVTCMNHGARICDKASTRTTFLDKKYVKTPEFDTAVKRFVTHFVKKHGKKP
jgi:hypothetical protein